MAWAALELSRKEKKEVLRMAGYGGEGPAGSGEPMTHEQMRTFASGATRGGGDKLDYFGFYCPWVLERYAEYLHEHRIQVDGKEREADNWKKGMPKIEYLRSMIRHVINAWQAHLDGGLSRKFLQDALCAIMFNAMGYLHEDLKENRNTEGGGPS